MRQNRRASVANRVLLILIIVASLGLLYYRSDPRLTQADRECIQDEWIGNVSVPGTEDLGAGYRISFTDIQKTLNWTYLPPIPDAENHPDVLMMIVSNSDDFGRRNVLRETWMSGKNSRIVGQKRMKCMFLVGKRNEKSDRLVLEEAKLYGDMVVADFEDDYEGLPFKSLSMLLYGVTKFPDTELIGKIDQDVLFFPDQLDEFMNNGLINSSSLSIYGHLYEPGVPVNRGEEGDKWRIRESSYKCQVYPAYLSGPFYLVTRKAAKRILTGTKHRKFISVEDTLITGLLAGDVGVHKTGLPHVYNVHKATSDKHKSEILAWHTFKNNKQYVESFEYLRKTRCKPCNQKL